MRIIRMPLTEVLKLNCMRFNQEVSMDCMWEMLRYRMQFGEAETAVIIAALIKVGAWFK